MKRTVELTFRVDVETDDSKFTPEFMAEFRQSFFDFDTLNEHAAYIAQLAVSDALDERFTEGYGPLKDMGISAKVMMFEEPRVVEP